MENMPLCPVKQGDTIVKKQQLVKLSVFIFLLFDYLILTMPIPILPDELSCSASTANSFRLGCVGDKLILVIFACKPLVQVTVGHFVGKWIDSQGTKTPLMVSITVLWFSTFFFTTGLVLNRGYADTATVVVPLLIIARMVQGIGSAGINYAGLALVNLAFPPDERGNATGFVMGGTGLGMLAGPILSCLLVMILGPWLPFAVVLMFLGVAASVFAATAYGSTLLIEEEGSSSIIWVDPSILITASVVTVANMVIALAEPMIPLYVSKPPFNFSPTGQMFLFSIMTSSYILATIVVNRADRYAKWKFLAAGMFVMSVGVGSITRTDQMPTLIVSIAIIGAGIAAVDVPSSPLLAEIIESHGSKEYGQAATVLNTCTALGFAAGPLMGAGGMLFTESIKAMQLETLGLAVLSFLLALLSFRLRETRKVN